MEKQTTSDDAAKAGALPALAALGPATAPGTLDDLYIEHAPVLRRVAIRKFSVPPAEAQALVHDVFISCLLTNRNVRTNLRAYLIAALCNACRNYWRARRTEGRVFADEEPASDAITDDLFDGLAINLLVASTLARIGKRCSEVLKRYYLRGEDTPTIAAALETTRSNVNYMMHVCRKRARTIYEELTRVR
jgi:RNA polymerase sigma factor (sigma-70 family)